MCVICSKEVKDCDRALMCDKCEEWIHIKVTVKQHKHHQNNENEIFECKNCSKCNDTPILDSDIQLNSCNPNSCN